MPTVNSLCDTARQTIKQGDYAKAEVIIKHVLAHCPKSIEAYRVLGELYAESGRINEASRTFKLVLSADPEDFLAHVGLGVSFRDQGGLHDAIFELERAIELRPANNELRKEVARLRALRDGPQARPVETTRGMLAWIYLRDGQYERARQEFAAIVAADRSRLDALVGLVQALWRAERAVEAMQEGRQVLELAPDCVKVQLILADCYLKEGHRAEGQSLLDSARALDPDGTLAADLFEGLLPTWLDDQWRSEIPEVPPDNVPDRLLGVSSPTLTVTGSRGVTRARVD